MSDIENVVMRLEPHRKPSVQDYLALGRFLDKFEKQYVYPKLWGQKARKAEPHIDRIDGALRSYSKRLYQALRGERDADLLEVLGVKRIEDYHTTNPAVIFRHYREKRTRSGAGM